MFFSGCEWFSGSSRKGYLHNFVFLKVKINLIFQIYYLLLLAEINSETESQTGNSGSEDNMTKESGKSNSLTNGPTTPRNPLASAKRTSSTKKVKNR